ncbi:MAG: Crp/Fnr family transcriptional regulator [Pseudomonadota bacterium]
MAGDLIDTEFGLVVSGTAGIEYSLGNGRRCLSELMHSGDLINMTRHERQTQGTLIALGECCVLPLVKRDFETLARHHKDLSDAYHRQVEDQTGRLRDHIADLGAKTPLERIVSVLFELRRWPDASGDSAAQMILPILYKDIAAYTGMKPETVSRALRKLREARLISTDGADRERISLLNVPRLRRIANGGAPRKIKI